VIRQVSAFLRPETGLYGRLACPWSLTSPLLRQRSLHYVLELYFTRVFLPVDCSGWDLRLRYRSRRQA
jgi:hypothetical protein